MWGGSVTVWFKALAQHVRNPGLNPHKCTMSEIFPDVPEMEVCLRRHKTILNHLSNVAAYVSFQKTKTDEYALFQQFWIVLKYYLQYEFLYGAPNII